MDPIATCFDALERSARMNKTIVRQDLREVTVALGRLCLDQREGEAQAGMERLAALAKDGGERFAQALREELVMAVTEHVRSCDPRYLDHPKYDLVYTVEARERLEARLVVAEKLGLPADEAMLEAVERADGLLQSRLDQSKS
jgi:hypothetical protein